MVPEGPTFHEIIHEDHLTLIIAISNQQHKINVPKLGEQHDFGPEIADPLLRRPVQSFDRNSGKPTVDVSFVNVTTLVFVEHDLLENGTHEDLGLLVVEPESFTLVFRR
jgi:hypothetical protein